jgi:hypothetical protein
VVWECKTAREFRPAEWVRQARSHVRAAEESNVGDPGDLPVTVYWPDGVGEGSPEAAMGILPLPELVELLAEAGYTPVEKPAGQW